MKRQAFLQHLARHGCVLKREGASHSIFINLGTGKRCAVPRHREIGRLTVAAICAQLEVPPPAHE
ncbi:MAG: type II toxin-antitoxin system HicA family toxin [Armatimonadetes bacterium]|nr:type II toxin-antitoxin system HicA family toxin [Armatimonadota bacterium]